MTSTLIAGAVLAAALAIAACSGSVLPRQSSTAKPSVATTTVPQPQGSTFAVPGIALQFTYPNGFHQVRLARSQRIAGNTARASHAAIGLGIYDLLIVTRFPNRPVPLGIDNVRKLKPLFDKAVSAAIGRPVSSVVGRVGGLPALSYPAAPVVGLPVSATSRITTVFVGTDEYELDCQYTPMASRRMTAACDEMLATLRTGTQP
jgi:hypothetical protein